MTTLNSIAAKLSILGKKMIQVFLLSHREKIDPASVRVLGRLELSSWLLTMLYRKSGWKVVVGPGGIWEDDDSRKKEKGDTDNGSSAD